ncbi:MAG: histidine kinase [Desulfobacteraceae bacterium]|nr:histidine kinase [Desulfobacteraceae bacterium]MBC2756517.1 histidine kinase [Desulfobacteraceae bacterium]
MQKLYFHLDNPDSKGIKRIRGKEIPLGVRIIAVADYFEALTANRYFNESMPPEQVIDIVKDKSRTFFDRKIIDAFISYYRNEFLNNSTRRASSG